MPYATQQDIIDRYNSDVLLVVADDDNDDVVDVVKVDRALSDASEEIDAYIGARYTLPLAQVPAVLVRVCVDITLYRLSPDGAYTEEKRQRYEDAMGLLKGISKGTISLGVDDVDASEGSTDDVELIGPEREFSRKTMGRVT